MAEDWKWDLDKNGNIITKPVLGYATATAFGGMAGILGIEYAETDQEVQKISGKSSQFALTLEQCELLADALTKLANTIRERQSQSKGPII